MIWIRVIFTIAAISFFEEVVNAAALTNPFLENKAREMADHSQKRIANNPYPGDPASFIKHCIEWALFLPHRERENAWDARVERGYMIFIANGLEAFMAFQRRILETKIVELLINK